MAFLIPTAIMIILFYFLLIRPDKKKRMQKMISDQNIKNYLSDICKFITTPNSPISEALTKGAGNMYSHQTYHVWLIFYNSKTVFEIRTVINGNVSTEQSIAATYSEYNIPQLNNSQTKILKGLVIDKLKSIPYIKPISMSAYEIRLQPVVK